MIRGPTLKTLRRQRDDWNAQIKIGDLVEFRSLIDSSPLIYRTRSEASILGGHSAVIWLEGKASCVVIEHCRKAAQQ